MRALQSIRRIVPAFLIGTFCGIELGQRKQQHPESSLLSVLKDASQSIGFAGFLQASGAEQKLPVTIEQQYDLEIRSKPKYDLPKGNASALLSTVGFSTLENIRDHGDFVLAYDTRNRIPRWVYETVDKQSVARRRRSSSDSSSDESGFADPNQSSGRIDRSKYEFYEDASFHEFFRATLADYKRSGYQRGHLAAAANHQTDPATYGRTFILSNIAPQIGDLNCGPWKELEHYVRHIARDASVRRVHVLSGPLFLPVIGDDSASGSSSAEPIKNDGDNGRKRKRLRIIYDVIGEKNVAVPTHFFKAVLIEPEKGEDYQALCYVMPNDSAALSKMLGRPVDINSRFSKAELMRFAVPFDVVERSAGFLVFEKAKSRIRLVNESPYRYSSR